MDDEVRIPFIFVRHGDPPPTDWMRRHPDWIKIPALFVPHSTSEKDRRAAVAAFYGWPAVDGGERWGADEAGTAPTLTVAASSTTATPKPDEGVGTPSGPYVAPDPQRWIGQPSVGTGECVALVQQATGAPRSTEWRPGALVAGNMQIQPGTAIATFDANGHYKGHAAIVIGQDANGIQVIDQWNVRNPDGSIQKQHTPSVRTLPIGDQHHKFVDRGESYHVIILQ